MDALPPKLRQKVLMKIKAKGKGGADDDDDDDDEDDEENEAALAKAALTAGKWGSSKSAYRGGDTADLEIGQDEQDAWDEEDAALEQQRQKLSSMRESDFLGGFSDEDGDDDDDEDAEQGAGGSDYFSSRAKAKGSAGGMLGTLEAVVLGAEKVSELITSPSHSLVFLSVSFSFSFSFSCFYSLAFVSPSSSSPSPPTPLRAASAPVPPAGQ